MTNRCLVGLQFQRKEIDISNIYVKATYIIESIYTCLYIIHLQKIYTCMIGIRTSIHTCVYTQNNQDVSLYHPVSFLRNSIHLLS